MINRSKLYQNIETFTAKHQHNANKKLRRRTYMAISLGIQVPLDVAYKLHKDPRDQMESWHKYSMLKDIMT
jgi:hypothetical protein